VAVQSLSLSAAMMANNTLLNIYKESLPKESFNKYTLFFLALLSVPGLLVAIPAMFVLGRDGLTDTRFFIEYFCWEVASGLLYVPGFIALRNLHVFNEIPKPPRQSFKEQFTCLIRKRAAVIFALAFLQSVWVGLILTFGVVYLLKGANWSTGKVAVWEAVLSIAMMVISPYFGKMADKLGYAASMSVLFVPMVLCAILFYFFPLNSFVIVAVMVAFHTGAGIIGGGYRNLTSAAVIQIAPPELTVRYLAGFSLISQLSIFLSCFFSGWFLSWIAHGSAEPTIADYSRYFLFANMLLIPQWILSTFLKKRWFVHEEK